MSLRKSSVDCAYVLTGVDVAQVLATADCLRVLATVICSQMSAIVASALVLATVDCAQMSAIVDCALVLATADCVHMLTGDAMLRGFGGAAVKSALLLVVSVQPSDLRRIALVLLAAGAGALPLKHEAVAP